MCTQNLGRSGLYCQPTDHPGNSKDTNHVYLRVPEMRWSRLLNDFIRSQWNTIWHTIPGILAFCLHLCPTWWPNAYHSSRYQVLTHDKKKKEGREGSKKGLSLSNLFISQWKKSVLRSSLMDFACYLIDQMCSHDHTYLQVVLGKQLFPASTLERGKGRNDI